MTLDSNLTFESYITFNIVKFRHIRNSLTIVASETFLHAMIFSHLHYCISCWSQASKTVLKPIEIIFKQALNVFDRKSLNHHHHNILSKYNLLSFENLILFSELQLVFKIIHNAAPPPLKSFFSAPLWANEQNLSRFCSFALNSDLNIPLQRTAFAQSAFSFTGHQTLEYASSWA